ncbi:hypothetical protein KIPB_013229 [Kipferlia bialata]|uniref:Uncharacterized protein n=1 Tax=Kipferlia bialata TaxID=797122 RepID=A0A9K3GPH8_9EUKA|nr:hypothetical protein KIPB_013229 [Kipferlia bialata]|eukprot:g13229.t1
MARRSRSKDRVRDEIFRQCRIRNYSITAEGLEYLRGLVRQSENAAEGGFSFQEFSDYLEQLLNAIDPQSLPPTLALSRDLLHNVTESLKTRETAGVHSYIRVVPIQVL